MPKCPDWHYEQTEGARDTLRDAAHALLLELRDGQLDVPAVAADTRPIHKRLFQALAPKGHAYYAGNYRGSQIPCLKRYRVWIPSDSMVGEPPATVSPRMDELRHIIDAEIAALDKSKAEHDSGARSRAALMVNVAQVCARLFEHFLRIHPYVDGNGHSARFIVTALFSRYGFWTSQWTVEPRPPLPGYAEVIALYRRGNRGPLERMLLELLRWGGRPPS
jgi:fido (protein-threonine AMPylation protein)